MTEQKPCGCLEGAIWLVRWTAVTCPTTIKAGIWQMSKVEYRRSKEIGWSNLYELTQCGPDNWLLSCCALKTSHPSFFFLFSPLNICHLTLFSPFFLSSCLRVAPGKPLPFCDCSIFAGGGHSVRVACCTPDDWSQQFHAFPLWIPDTRNNKWIWAWAKTKATSPFNCEHYWFENTLFTKLLKTKASFYLFAKIVCLFIQFVSSTCLFPGTVCFEAKWQYKDKATRANTSILRINEDITIPLPTAGFLFHLYHFLLLAP